MKHFLSLMLALCLCCSASINASNIAIIDPPGALSPLPVHKLHALVNSGSLDALLAASSGKKVVMLGESTHGTHEYYMWRDLISRRLLSEQGFNFILVEGDFASLYEVNRYVKHQPGAANSGRLLLESLSRWPQWIWGNEEVVEFVEWLHKFNADKPLAERVGFYGMDVYDEWRSYRTLLADLKKLDKQVYRRVKKAYSCLDRYQNKSWDYAQAVRSGRVNCAEALESVVDLMESSESGVAKLDKETRFYLQQNARVVQNAERYYRTALNDSEVVSWNGRVEHMQDTLARLLLHYGEDAKAIVWAHNSHVGDARYTSMRQSSHTNIGQLAREYWGKEALLLVGFTSYQGKTIAAIRWGEFMAEMTVPPAQRGSHEAWLAQAELDNFYWVFDDEDRADTESLTPRGNRALGVVYRPSNDSDQYEPTILPLRYDVKIFMRETGALMPLKVPKP